MSLVGRRISLFWIVHGLTRMSTSLQLLPGLGSESPRSLTIGFDEWLLTNIVLQSLFLAGPSTDRAAVGRLRPRMNFLMRLSFGLEIAIHDTERGGRKARDWRSSSRIVGPYWFWMGWSRSKIRLVHKTGGCVSLRYRLSWASLLPSIRGFALLPRDFRSLILRITSTPRPCAVTWNNYPAMPVQ